MEKHALLYVDCKDLEVEISEDFVSVNPELFHFKKEVREEIYNAHIVIYVKKDKTGITIKSRY